MKPLVFQSVGDIELKDHERLENVLDAAHTKMNEKTGVKSNESGTNSLKQLCHLDMHGHKSQRDSSPRRRNQSIPLG